MLEQQAQIGHHLKQLHMPSIRHAYEDVANQAVVMAEELIKKNLQETDQVKLIEDYLTKVGTVQ